MYSILYELNLFGLSIPIYSYGLCLGISLVAGWHLAAYFATQKDDIPLKPLKRAIVWTVIGALVFARVFFYIGNPSAWHGFGDFLRLNQGGLVAYGGFIGGILTAYIALGRRGINFWRFADHAAPALALGLMVTRIGCFLNGCDFGHVTNVAWAISFPKGSPPWEHHVSQGLITPDAARSLAVHPTQLYESAVGLGLLLFLLWARTWKKRFYGQGLLLFLGLYGLIRFGLEFIRDDPQRGQLWGLSTSQWIALCMVGAVLALPMYLRRHQQPVELVPHGAAAARAQSGARR